MLPPMRKLAPPIVLTIEGVVAVEIAVPFDVSALKLGADGRHLVPAPCVVLVGVEFVATVLQAVTADRAVSVQQLIVAPSA